MKIQSSLLIAGLVLIFLGVIAIYLYILTRFGPKGSTLSIGNDWLIAFITVTVTLIGAWYIFQKEGERLEVSFKAEIENQRQVEHGIYKRSFVALLTELSANQALIKKQKEKMTQTSFNLEMYEKVIAEKIVSEPLTYKYTGEDFWISLQAYLTTVKIANRWLDFLWDGFQKSGQITEKNLTDFKERLDQCHRALLVVEIQTQILIYGNDVKGGPTLGDGKMYLRWLTGEEKKSPEELVKYLQDLSTLSDDEKKKLRESFAATIKD